jgi:hypothetical protein
MRSFLVIGTFAAGAALYLVFRRRRSLEGTWYSIAKADGKPNGDEYEFRFEGGVYKIIRDKRDHFTVVGNQVKHAHGPKATILSNGDLHWDIDGGKWLSRRKPQLQLMIDAVRTKLSGFMRLTLDPGDDNKRWPPAHAPAEAAHFDQLKSEGGVHQVWLIAKHDGGQYVQHNYDDGTYKAYEHAGDDEVDAGKWTLKDGVYSEQSKHDFASSGKLIGTHMRFHMDVECGPLGYHKYTPTYETYVAGTLESELPEALPHDEDALNLVLVKKGSSAAVVFEHAEELAKGEDFVPLTLKSHGGGDRAAIVLKKPRYRSVHHFKLHTPSVGKAELAVKARLDAAGGHLTLESNGFVLDVDKWKFEENNRLWFLQEGEDAASGQTRKSDGGRSFMINAADGTLSPTKAPDLVLGVASIAQLCLVEKGSERACVFEHAAALKAGEDGVKKTTDAATALTLSSHPGLAVVTKYETPRNFHDYCEYIELGVAPVSKEHLALLAHYDADTWLVRDTVVVTKAVMYKGKPLVEPEVKEYAMVFDVAFGKMETGNGVNMLQRLGSEPTKEEGNKARSFVVHDDGTVSPAEAPHLVLGMDFVPKVL